jgi:hypothetical protein
LRALPARPGINQKTGARGRKRESVSDHSISPSKPKSTVLSIEKEAIDVAKGQTVGGKLYLFVAIDRTSKFAFRQPAENASRRAASAILKGLIKEAPYKIQTVLTDNGIPFRRGTPMTQPTES